MHKLEISIRQAKIKQAKTSSLVGLLMPTAPIHNKATMHRTTPMDYVKMNAYFNDQSCEYQTRIITMAEKLDLHLKKLALTSPLGAVATINKGATHSLIWS